MKTIRNFETETDLTKNISIDLRYDMDVVQGNELIEGTYRAGIDEMRLLYISLSKVDSRNPFKPVPYKIKAEDFSNVFDIPIKASYSRLKKAVEKLMVTTITINQTMGDGRIRRVKRHWFSEIAYVVNDCAEVEVIFNEHVRPHLYALKRDFTTVRLENIARLDSPFSIRLYTLLTRHKFKTKTKTKTFSVRLDYVWLKERAGYSDSYKDVRDFMKRMIDPSVDKINDRTDIDVVCSPVRKGRSIYAFDFLVTKKNDASDDASDDVSDVNVVPELLSRPCLPSRPRVKKGSHNESEWARRCISALTQYREELILRDKDLSVADLRKLSSYYKIIGDTVSQELIDNHIQKRARSKKDKAKDEAL